jgi:hypothetical protein
VRNRSPGPRLDIFANGGTRRSAAPLLQAPTPLAKPITRNPNPCLADALVVDCADSLTRSLWRPAYRSCRASDVNLRRRSKSIAPKRTSYLRFFAPPFFFEAFFAAFFAFAFFAMLLS